MEINQKKLHDHFVRTEQKERAEAILKVYPHFAEKPKADKTKKKD